MIRRRSTLLLACSLAMTSMAAKADDASSGTSSGGSTPTLADKAKTMQALMPASGLTNSATPGTDAGKAEAAYLSAKLIKNLAAKIAQDTQGKIKCDPVSAASDSDPDSPKSLADALGQLAVSADGTQVQQPEGRSITPTVVVIAGTTAPDLSDWTAFDQRLELVSRNLAAADYQFQHPKAQGDGTIKFAAFPLIMSVLPSILSYLNSADAAQGISITYEDGMLSSAVAGRIASTNTCEVVVAGQTFNRLSARHLNNALSALTKEYQQVVTDIGSLKKNKPRLASDEGKSTLAALNLSKAQYESLYADTFGSVAKDGKFVPATIPMGNVLKEYTVAEALRHGYALFVHIDSENGGLFTRKNIGTFFMANPFWVSASAIASFSLVDGQTERVLAGDTLNAITPYKPIPAVRADEHADSTG